MLKNWDLDGFTHYLSYIVAEKNFLFFLMRWGIHCPPLDQFYYIRKLVFISCILKRTCNFSLLSAASKRLEITISESLKFIGSICRIVKKSKKYFPLEYFIDNAIQFSRFFILWQILIKVQDSKIKTLMTSENRALIFSFFLNPKKIKFLRSEGIEIFVIKFL